MSAHLRITALGAILLSIVPLHGATMTTSAECDALKRCSSAGAAPAALIPDPYLRTASVTPQDVAYDRTLDVLLAAQRRVTMLEELAWEASDALDRHIAIHGAATDAGLVSAEMNALRRQIEVARASLRTAEQTAASARAVREERAGPGAAQPGYRGTPTERGTLLVLFRKGSPVEAMEEVLRRHQLDVRSRVSEIPLVVVRARSTPDDDRPYETEAARLRVLTRLLQDEPLVEAAVQNVTLCENRLTPAIDPKLRDWFSKDDPLVASHFPEAWNFLDAIGKKTPVPVGVLDLGFVAHEDLALDILGDCGTGVDHHGTGVAGIIAAGFDDGKGIDGAAAGLASVVACAPDSSSAEATSVECERKITFDAFLCGLRHLFCVKDLRVVNASIGYAWSKLSIIAEKTPAARAVVEAQGTIVREMLSVHDQTLIVASAGNDCKDDKNCATYTVWNSPFTWAALGKTTATSFPSENVIVVEAITPAGAHHSTSNEGGTIGAVGQDVLTTARTKTGGKYGFMSGTSAATPLVTSTVALMLARNNALTAAAIKTNLTAAGGKLNAYDAVRRSSPTPDLDLADLHRDGVIDRRDFDEFKPGYQQVRDRTFTLDLNGDGLTDANDARFCRIDLDGDGDVDKDDFEVMLSVWGDPTADKNALRRDLEK